MEVTRWHGRLLPARALADVQGFLKTPSSSGCSWPGRVRISHRASTTAPRLRSPDRSRPPPAPGRPAVASVSTLLRKNPVVSTPPGELHALVSQLPVFIEVSPVYLGPEPPTTPGRRLKALAGWTMGIFDATRDLEPALANESGVCLGARVRPTWSPAKLPCRGRAPPDRRCHAELSVPADPGWVIRAAVNPRGGAVTEAPGP